MKYLAEEEEKDFIDRDHESFDIIISCLRVTRQKEKFKLNMLPNNAVDLRKLILNKLEIGKIGHRKIKTVKNK